MNFVFKLNYVCASEHILMLIDLSLCVKIGGGDLSGSNEGFDGGGGGGGASSTCGARTSANKDRNMQLDEQLLLDPSNPDRHENAVLELSKIYILTFRGLL